MATKGQLERICREENKKRNVDLPRNAYNSSVFCNNTKGGFSVIGESPYKNNVVLDYVAARLRAGIKPVVILSNSEELENKLIQYVSTSGGSLAVVSPAYKTYSIFSSMKDSDIIQCLSEAARTVGADTDNLVQYTYAFLSVMRFCNIPVSLHSMIKLSNSSNDSIVNIAKAKGVRSDFVDSLQNNVTKLDVLRYLLEFISDSLSAFADASRDSGRSLISLLSDTTSPRDVIFIRPVSKNPELTNYILATELQALSGRKGLFVFDNINSFNCNKLETTIDNLRNSGSAVVGECIKNPVLTANTQTQTISGTSFVIFPGGVSQVYLQNTLPSFGKYIHHSVQLGGGKEDFHILGNKHWNIVKEERDRLMINDVNGKAAIFGGDKGVTLTVANAVTGIFAGGNENGALRRI